jgi:metallophosphoesterase superfamily enzyme
VLQLILFGLFFSSPDVVFFLGDVFDEGKWCDDDEFAAYRRRFSTLFATRDPQKVVVVAGNHDIGFHYAVTPYLNSR